MADDLLDRRARYGTVLEAEPEPEADAHDSEGDGAQSDRPRSTRRHRGRTILVAAASIALVAVAVAALVQTLGSSNEADLGEEPIGASGDDVADEAVERLAIDQVEAFESTLDEPITLFEGVDPTYGEWFVSIEPSRSGLAGGYCTFSNSGGGCRIDPDLDRFGLQFLDGQPIPVAGWAAPAPIETVRVWWEDGRVEDVAVAHIPGESWGLAATIMPASGAGFSYAALDGDGDVVVERQDRPPYRDLGTHP